MSRDWGRFA